MENTPVFERKTGFTKKKIFLYLAGFIILLVIVKNIGKDENKNSSDTPEGKSYINVTGTGWTQIDLGNTNLGGTDFVNYNKHLFDANRNPAGVIHREGTFTVDGNTVNCKFKDGQPPYKLKYMRKNANDESLFDENGEEYMR